MANLLKGPPYFFIIPVTAKGRGRAPPEPKIHRKEKVK